MTDFHILTIKTDKT